MGFEAKAERRAADGVEAPSSPEENYRRWLLSTRDRIDSELVRLRIREEEEAEKKRAATKAVLLRSKKYHVARGVMFSSSAVLAFSGFLFPRDPTSRSEFRRFMRFEAAVLAVFAISALFLNHVIRSLLGGTGTDGTAAAQPSCQSSPASDAV